MEMPEIHRCFGIFPPKYATFLIAVFGLASGGVGIAGIVLYGIAEEKVTSTFVSKPQDELNEDIKKVVLMTIGFSSILLLAGNAFLFIGASGKTKGGVMTGVYILFIMCVLLITGAMAAPLACFFLSSTCLVKKVSTIVVTAAILALTIFIEIWLYFIAVAWSYDQELV